MIMKTGMRATSRVRKVGDLVVAVCMAMGLAACQSTPASTTESARAGGQYMDDTAMTSAVKSKLAMDRMANLTRINVTSNNGIVQLNGVVETPEQKEQASRLAGQVEGVQRVDNNLQVRRAAVTGQSDRVLQ